MNSVSTVTTSAFWILVTGRLHDGSYGFKVALTAFLFSFSFLSLA